MITEKKRLELEQDFKDSLFWKKHPPMMYWGSGKCSKCGESVRPEEEISFSITCPGHEECYLYHHSCAQETLDNASEEEIRQNFKDKPVLIPL